MPVRYIYIYKEIDRYREIYIYRESQYIGMGGLNFGEIPHFKQKLTFLIPNS